MSKAPTLEDVAAAAGVSTATVSRCLNTPDKVVAQTRRRVLAAVEALGYAPNFSARALVAKRTQTIGAVIPTMENAVFAEGIQAFQDVLQAQRFMLLIASSGYDPKAEADAVRTLVARGADGVLLIGFDRDDNVYEFLASQRIPAVVAWAYKDGGPLPSVGFDNAAAMERLVSHAIGLGHARVGLISGIQAGNDRARARVTGAQAALGAAGIEAATVVETSYGFAQGGSALDRLLDRDPDLTLVVCGNDVLAAGAVRRARALGLSVPADLSITGFDDIGLAELVDPPLTTVRVPHRAMGQAAAERLLALVTGQSAHSLRLDAQLCLRESLAKVRGK
ncbi:MAG: LacI family DNA-binding transcriptional regulator [Pseudomonadota bacterium]